MEGSEPNSVLLNLDEAFDFLQEGAWVLEDAGFKVIVPAWLTPKGRRRAKIRLRTGGKSPAKTANAQSFFSMDTLTDYHYELPLGDEALIPEEWRQLVEAKTPLIHFRGQWMQLDRDNMQEMLAFMQQQNQQPPALPIHDLLKKLAEEADSFELDAQDSLAQMLAKLADNSQLEPIGNPAKFNAQLREYQKRGVAWLRYLESLGLNGCLADDMGLGKTMQVISLLVLEREQGQPAPTLLIAPTSIIGNWQKELEKFAPQLTTLIHHGGGREQDAKTFMALCQQHDVLITSYTLARKDGKLLEARHWRRIVLDEAQNIKNPTAAQTKAILKFKADSRLALTGTPVENRLMDLWSIFNFLNPGYLGKQAQFRKNYELPVQRDNNPIQSAVPKKLLQPFILRRLKTDKNIIGERLERYLHRDKHYKTYYLHGGTHRNKREQMISDFQNPDNGAAVFILSLKAGGVGITLTRANHVFHFDRWWNPAVENQATDRAFRIGQQKNAFVHKFITLGTLEERIDQMISDKQKIADSIVGNDESWLAKLDNQAFKSLITLNKHGKVEAKVRGNINPYFGVYQEPTYKVSVQMVHLTETQWQTIIGQLTQRASFVAQLLLNEIPENIETVFANAGVHLLPDSYKDFKVACDCPDYAVPCKHIAGICFRLAQQFDQDPFLLFEMRGLTPTNLFAALANPPLGKVLSDAQNGEEAGLSPVDSFYTRPLPATIPETTSQKAFWHGQQPLPKTIEPSQAALIPATLVKKGGDYPGFWQKQSSFIGVMEEFYLRMRKNIKKEL